MNEKCREYNTKKEIMVKDSEKNTQICGFCGETLNLGFSAPSIKTGDNGNRLKV
jgi:hypothetical protein